MIDHSGFHSGQWKMQENLERSWRGMVTVEQGGILLLLYNTALTYSVPDQLSVSVLLVNMQKTNHSFKIMFVDGLKKIALSNCCAV